MSRVGGIRAGRRSSDWYQSPGHDESVGWGESFWWCVSKIELMQCLSHTALRCSEI